MAILLNAASAVLLAAAPGAAHGEAAAHKAGMPQLATETFAGQLFWLAITFGLLFVVLTWVVIPRIQGVLAKRAGTISGDLAAAAAAKSEADEALKAYEKAVADARARGRTLADDTRNTLKAESEARRAETEAKLATELAAAEARIASMKSEALSNVRAVAADTASDIVARLTGETVAPAEAAKAVDAALAR